MFPFELRILIEHVAKRIPIKSELHVEVGFWFKYHLSPGILMRF